MKTLFIGKNCIEVEKTDSTNSFLARMLSEMKVFEGTLVITKNQERGRGQRGASWESEPGKNLTLSILLQPSFLGIEQQFQLNKAVSLGVLQFIKLSLSPIPLFSPPGAESESGGAGERVEGRLSIKWPNDIYIGNKKVAGILIENSVSGNKLQQSIIGIGINVNQDKFSAGLPNPTSLKLAIGKEFDLKECLEELCSCIEKRYLELRAGHADRIDADYLKNLYRFNEFASYKYKGEELKAKITGLSKVGKLILEIENGKILECDFKEITNL